MFRHSMVGAAALCYLITSSVAFAGGTVTSTAPFEVKVKVVASCTVSTSRVVQLGSASGIGANAVNSSLTQNGTVTANCPDGLQYSFTLTSRDSDGWVMKGTGSNSATIPYLVQLVSFSGGGGSAANNGVPLNRGFASGTTSDKLLVGGGGDSKLTFSFTAGTPSGNLPPDDYSDIVDVSLSY